ncbi:MAG TPA: cellulase family glycosylhydrolase [Planctomicrobium sp.]|nr:cellulase family glycosylhydrolase [Planctomicrobium sp.]
MPMRGYIFLLGSLLLLTVVERSAFSGNLPWITVSQDQSGFVYTPGGEPFRPVGFNYDRDDAGRLLEDYWTDEWDVVKEHFSQMKEMGANVVRIHLQLARFMQTQETSDQSSLDRLKKLLELAETEQIYLNLTGLGCYHKQDVPEWYDALDESGRWETQARFWQAIAQVCAQSPAVFCYNLMNEPIVPGGKRKAEDWLGPALAGKHYVQRISLDLAGRKRPDVAREWIITLKNAIRKEDKRHLVTVGLVDWSLDRPGLSSGFIPSEVVGELDFISVHLYPESGKLHEAIETLTQFSVGKPVVIEETFPLKCSLEEFAEFIDRSQAHTSGWFGFYWGVPIEKLQSSRELKDQLIGGWLSFFKTKLSPLATTPP